MPKFILASSSPRRRELLSTLIPAFEIISPDVDEDAHFVHPLSLGVIRVAEEKARAVSETNPDAVIIAADTLVDVDNAPLGKPTDQQDAFRMLKLLSGRTHEVLTAVAVMNKGRLISDAERTLVTFTEMSDADIRMYIATGEPMDKAGAYGIQGRASMFITGINGCYFNVVGLPVFRTGQLLVKAGIIPTDLWQSS